MDSLRLAFEWADHAAAAVLPPLSLWIFVSGIDDLFILAAYLRAWLTGQLPTPPPVAAENVTQRRIAIFVPLWQEEDVIRGMLEHNLAAVKYENFEFFVGAYPNDPGTTRAIQSVAARSPRVHLALCPHSGPTSKADCLNWIYQRMLLHEREHGVNFDVVMTHDAEDLIHPEELRLVNHYLDSFDMIQVPVLPLPTPPGEWVHGIYCDDFAEFHTKDLPARWWLGGFIPSSGVGTAFCRKAIDALAVADSSLIFRPDCLTEDYEMGYRLRRLGFTQLFMPISRAGADRQPVATREFFPRNFRAARRQRTRWTTGIALQGWARNGWGANWREAYWFWRDRKGLIGNPASLLANLIFLYGAATWTLSVTMGMPWGLAGQSQLIAPTAVMGVVLALSRAACSASIYGWRFAASSPLRSSLGNYLNSVASLGALSRFARSAWLGEPLVWLKTEHAYPNLAALETYKQPIDSILVATGAVAAEALEEARKTAGVRSLAEHLLALNLVSEDDLLEALMLRHRLPGGAIPTNGVSPALLRLLPVGLTSAAKVMPVALSDGILKLACPDLPAETALDRLRIQVRLPFEFHLVTRRNFIELSFLADQSRLN